MAASSPPLSNYNHDHFPNSERRRPDDVISGTYSLHNCIDTFQSCIHHATGTDLSFNVPAGAMSMVSIIQTVEGTFQGNIMHQLCH